MREWRLSHDAIHVVEPVELERAEASAWHALEGRLSRSLAERRKEPIVLRIAGAERATELLVGWSLVLPRNQQVFAARSLTLAAQIPWWRRAASAGRRLATRRRIRTHPQPLHRSASIECSHAEPTPESHAL